MDYKWSTLELILMHPHGATLLFLLSIVIGVPLKFWFGYRLLFDITMNSLLIDNMLNNSLTYLTENTNVISLYAITK